MNVCAEAVAFGRANPGRRRHDRDGGGYGPTQAGRNRPGDGGGAAVRGVPRDDDRLFARGAGDTAHGRVVVHAAGAGIVGGAVSAVIGSGAGEAEEVPLTKVPDPEYRRAAMLACVSAPNDRPPELSGWPVGLLERRPALQREAREERNFAAIFRHPRQQRITTGCGFPALPIRRERERSVDDAGSPC